MKTSHVLIGSAIFIASVGTMYYFYQKNRQVGTDIEWEIEPQGLIPLPEEEVPVFDDDNGFDMASSFTEPDFNSDYSNYDYSYNYGY